MAMAIVEVCLFLSATITVALAAPAKLQIQPNVKEVTKEVGGSLALTCRPIVDDPSLVRNLEWRDSKGRRIDSVARTNPIYVQSLPAEPGSVLIFSRITNNQGGEYTCHANYASSETIKASILVSTFEDIIFVDAPESQYPIAGKDFKIKCKVSGNPAPLIDWNKNDKNIVTNQKYVVMSDGLFLKNVSEIDDGEYKCTAVVLSTGQIKNRNIKVEVQVPPKVAPMETVTVIEGETASTICKASGKPPPKYSWIKERTREDLSKTDRFGVKENTGDLIITRVEYNDDSYYKCTAENPAGRSETRVKINVLVKPRIYELLNVTAPVTAETKIICKVKGRPPPKVTFKKRGAAEAFRPDQQLLDKRIILEQEFRDEQGETFATLIISNLNRTDDGLYECIAENQAGADYRNGHIAVEFPPTFARTKDLPPVWSWDDKPGNLSCLPEAIPNATIVWKKNGIILENDQVFQKQLWGANGFLIVRPHNDHRFYSTYECHASNKLGEAVIRIELRHATVPGSVAQSKAQRITATTVKFSIVPPSNWEGLPIRSFIVQYRPERQISWDFARNHTWSNGAPYILENLEPEITYHFRFAAKNDVGMGAFTNSETITMPRRSEPAEPKILVSNHDLNSSNRVDMVTVSPYADHFELRWNVPNDNGDPIQHYLVRFCVTEKVNGEWRDSDCSEQIQQSVQYTSYQLDSLRPDTTYKIELRAHNAIGDSSPAQIRMKTARGLDPIIPIKQASISSTKIIGIVIGSVVLVLLLVDITCFCINRTGILALMCTSKAKQPDEEDPKLGREEREPLRPEPISGAGEKPMTIEYDGTHVYSKTGEIIGKNSAV